MPEKPNSNFKGEKKASSKRSSKQDTPLRRGKEHHISKDRNEAKPEKITYSFSLLGERGSIQLSANSSKKEIMKAKAKAQFINRNEKLRIREQEKLKIPKSSIIDKAKDTKTADLYSKQRCILPQFESSKLEIAAKKMPNGHNIDIGLERSHKSQLKHDKKISPSFQISSKHSKPKDEAAFEQNKVEIKNSPLFRLDNSGKMPNFQAKVVEKGNPEADTSLQKTQIIYKPKQDHKNPRKSKESHNNHKHGNEFLREALFADENGFKKKLKKD